MSKTQTYRVEKLEAVAAMEEYRRDCVRVEQFLACCKVCPNYMRTWSCPEFDFDPQQLWAGFGSLHLVGRQLFFPANTDERTALAALKREKAALHTELLAMEARAAGSLALSAGSCELCEPQVCTRISGEACRHPQSCRHSIEALGGDVSLTARRYLGRSLLWMQDGLAPEYLMLVGGLLLPSDC